MDAVETLMQEHRVIERALDALEACADAVAQGRAEPAELSEFVVFLREFADACHHGKEEDILFAAMADAGFPTTGGPLAVMLHEHREGRALVGAIAECAAGTGDAGERARGRDAAHGFAALLRAHIGKEDRILYPMARARLAPAAWRDIEERFERFEEERIGAKHESLHALAERLVGRWAPHVTEGHVHA